MPTITCSRCNESKEQFDEPPAGGKLGQMLLERVCSDCWGEWRELSAQLINHHGLNLGMPDHRAELRRVMKEFLSLDEAS